MTYSGAAGRVSLLQGGRGWPAALAHRLFPPRDRLAEVPARSNGAVPGCFYRLPSSANGRRFGKCLIYAAASASGAKPTWELSQIPGIV